MAHSPDAEEDPFAVAPIPADTSRQLIRGAFAWADDSQAIALTGRPGAMAMGFCPPLVHHISAGIRRPNGRGLVNGWIWRWISHYSRAVFAD